MEKFLELMAEVYDLETGEIAPDDDIREIEGFCSLIGFSIIVTIDDEYGVDLTEDEFLECKTIRDLYNKIQTRK